MDTKNGNGGWKLSAGFISIGLLIGASFVASQSRLSALEVKVQAVEQRVSELKVDSTKALDRLESKIENLRGVKQ